MAMNLTPRMLLTAIAGTVVYLGLAINGIGGFAAFVSHPPLIVLALVTIVAAIVALFSSGNLSAGIREDRGNRWVLGAFAVIGLLLAWLPAYTDRIGFWTLDGEPLRWVGAAIYIGGVIVRMWPVFILGRRFSGLVAIQSDHALVTTGLYSMIRHPSYMGLLISSLGWALAFRSIVGVLLAALTAVPLIARIRAEEALLASQFGAAYAAYRARTSRLLPHVW
jgi:protein-S-isoprenylcysteine O-methyltransferase Ste14